MSEKPPIGLKPRKLHIEERLSEISQAIQSYILANKQTPMIWIDELSELLALRNRIIQESPFEPFWGESEIKPKPVISPSNDWIEWKGGVQPVSDFVFVEARLANEKIIKEYASDLNWNLSPKTFYNEVIIAYRVIK